MRIVLILLPMAASLICFIGCRAVDHACQQGDSSTTAKTQPVYQNPSGNVLEPEEALRIARTTLRERHIALAGYVCEGPFWGGGGLTNQWTVIFRREPAVPDDYLAVIIDDRSGQARVWEP